MLRPCLVALTVLQSRASAIFLAIALCLQTFVGLRPLRLSRWARLEDNALFFSLNKHYCFAIRLLVFIIVFFVASFWNAPFDTSFITVFFVSCEHQARL